MDPQALAELTASVAQHGILEPILFRRDQDTGILHVIAGERRCAAARKAGLFSVPAIFIDSGHFGEIALVENLLRQDLNPIEESEALQRLMDEHAYKQDDLARIIGRSAPTISESLSLMKLPREIRDECRQEPTVPKNVLVAIARNKQQRSMVTAYRKYREQQRLLGVPKTPGAKRTKAEALVNNIGTTERKIAALDLTTLSPEDQAMVGEALNALKKTLTDFLAAGGNSGKEPA
jgi:ParB family chromosome partitioning protein